MDRRPQVLGATELDPLPEKLTQVLREQAWIEDAVVRVRERGREFIAEALVVPCNDGASLREVETASRRPGPWTPGSNISR
jgi:hypothetical protein